MRFQIDVYESEFVRIEYMYYYYIFSIQFCTCKCYMFGAINEFNIYITIYNHSNGNYEMDKRLTWIESIQSNLFFDFIILYKSEEALPQNALHRRIDNNIVWQNGCTIWKMLWQSFQQYSNVYTKIDLRPFQKYSLNGIIFSNKTIWQCIIIFRKHYVEWSGSVKCMELGR